MISQLGHTNFSQHYATPVFAHHDNHPGIKEKTVEKQETLDKTGKTDVKEQQAVSKTFDVDALVETLYDQLASKVMLRSKGNDEDKEVLWQQAKDGIAAGFAEAKDILKAFGQMDDGLDTKINDAQVMLFERIDQQKQVQAFNKIESSFVHKEQKHFALEVKTLEGDTVRLLFNQSHHIKGRENVYGMDLSQMDMKQFRLDVVGDLNEEELEDIKSLFNDISKLSQEFYSGNMEQAFDLASKLNINDTSLMDLNLNLRSMTSTTQSTTYIKPTMQPNYGVEQYKQMQPDTEKMIDLNKQPGMAQLLEFLDGFNQELEQLGLPNLGQWMQQAQKANEDFMKIFDQSSQDFWSHDIAKLESLF
ncbi:MAG: DUF5610 domain-containing protein [Saccharospirillaceae bacterium]|nr:DUF5610 domain-containing protein [Pseudomonadales bacterium]NRB79500.1 DUF5610 domain-containing protein [Saccharospirillaceae bacterium]